MGRRSCLCLPLLMHLPSCGPVANVTGMVMLLWTYIQKHAFGWGVVGLLGRMGLEGKWVDKTTP